MNSDWKSICRQSRNEQWNETITQNTLIKMPGAFINQLAVLVADLLWTGGFSVLKADVADTIYTSGDILTMAANEPGDL